jgi:tetratricopeptide (TPR) repeat protein
VLDSIGETSSSSMQHAVRALFVAQLGRSEEALELSEVGERTAVAALGHAFARSAHALALSGLGRRDDALPIAHEAVEIMRRTSDIHGTAQTLQSLGDVLAAAGEEGEARIALEESRELFERKGCIVCVGNTLERLEALGA